MTETIQRAFTSGEISPALGARADLNKYQTGLATLRNCFVHPEGGVSNRPGYGYTGFVPANLPDGKLIPFQFNTEQTYMLVFVALKMMVIKDGGFVLNADQSIISITLATQCVVEITAHGYSNGDEIYFSDIVGTTDLNGNRFTVSDVTTDTFKIKWLSDGNYVDSSLFDAYVSSGNGASVFTLVTTYTATDLIDLKYVQSADTMTIVHPNFDPAELTRTGHNIWSLDVVDYSTVQVAPAVPSVTPFGTDPATDLKIYKYAVTAVNASGQESLQSPTIASASITVLGVARGNRLTIPATADAESFNIYKMESESSDVFGYIGTTKTNTFEDYNIAPDILDGPPTDRIPFDGAGNKPSTVNYYQQRIIFGGTDNKPETVDLSRIGDFHSMRVAIPTKADDSITFTMADQQVNKVRHIVSVGALLVLTSGGEWKITEGQDQVVTPSTVSARIQSKYGASSVLPVVVDNSALYIQESGSRLRDIGYTFESDSYTGSDLSIMAQHLFDGYTITDMAFAQEPHRMVWLVRSDGKLVALTYHKEHKVTGWSQHDTNGLVKAVSTIREGTENVVYIIVERVINGNTVRYVERLKERSWTTAENAFIVDSGLTYSGTAITEITGLYHLEGESVAVLADGNVVDDLVVSSRGTITLPNASSLVHIGIPYISDVETLDIDSSQRMVKGKLKSVGEVVYKFYNSRGGWVGPDADHLIEIKPRLQIDNYDSISLQSYEERIAIDSGWSDGGQTFFRQTDPLPFTILAIAPDVSIG